MLQETSSTSSPQSEQSIGEYDESTLVFRPVQLDHFGGAGQEDDGEQVDVRFLKRSSEFKFKYLKIKEDCYNCLKKCQRMYID